MELNKIYLGDCYELIEQMQDKSVDLIVTDPPYEIKGLQTKPHGLFTYKGRTRKYEQEMLKNKENKDELNQRKLF